MNHKKGHSRDHHPRQPHRHGSRGLHKDWRLWVAVILMLGAMAVYVLTLDESVGGRDVTPAAPAADGGP